MAKQVKITIVLDQPLQGEHTEEVTRMILGDPMAYGRYPSFSQERVKVEEIDTDNATSVGDIYTGFNDEGEFVIDTPTHKYELEKNDAISIAKEIFNRYNFLRLENLFVVVGADAGIIDSVLYYSKEKPDEICSKNTLGSYATVNLYDHIDSLLTWYEKGVEGYLRDKPKTDSEGKAAIIEAERRYPCKELSDKLAGGAELTEKENRQLFKNMDRQMAFFAALRWAKNITDPHELEIDRINPDGSEEYRIRTPEAPDDYNTPESLKRIAGNLMLCTRPIKGHTDPGSVVDCWKAISEISGKLFSRDEVKRIAFRAAELTGMAAKRGEQIPFLNINYPQIIENRGLVVGKPKDH